MSRLIYLVYGLICYALFLVAFTYAVGFIGGYDNVVPKAIDTGTEGPAPAAILVNVLLLSLFAIQHSVMARREFKSWWKKFVPEPIERSTFVLLSSLLLLLLYWQWRPMTDIVWQVDHHAGYWALTVLFFTGLLIVLYTTFLVDHFDLFGVRQVLLHWLGQPYTHRPFRAPTLYKLCRHPMMVGFIIGFWATPTMTTGHLLFALVTTAYINIAIRLEEREVVMILGDPYERYREQTPMLIPLPFRRKAAPQDRSGGTS